MQEDQERSADVPHAGTEDRRKKALADKPLHAVEGWNARLTGAEHGEL